MNFIVFSSTRFRHLVLGISLLVPVSGFLAGCDSKLDPKEYVSWVRDYQNNLHVRSSVSGFVFDLQYKPLEYILLQRGSQNSPGQTIQEELKKLDGLQYYTLTVSTTDKIDLVNYGVSSITEKQQKEYYLSYQFQNDITLEESGKVYPCVLYHFEKPSDPNGGRTLTLGFENPNTESKEAKVVINSELFSSLPVKIKVVKSNIPQVAL